MGEKQTFIEHAGTPLKFPETPEEIEAARPIIEKLLRRQKASQDFFDKLFRARNESKGDIPIKPRPELPDLTDLDRVEYDLQTVEVARLEERLIGLGEQYTAVSNRLVQIPDEIVSLEKEFSRNPNSGAEGAILRLELEAKTIRDHRQPQMAPNSHRPRPNSHLRRSRLRSR